MALITLDERLEQLRLELRELSEKQLNLDTFISTENYYKLSDEDQTLLILQNNTMETYRQILIRRIDLFIKNNINHLKID